MRKLSLALAGLLVIVFLALTITFFLAIEGSPRIDRRITLTPEHVERAKQVVDAHRWVPARDACCCQSDACRR
jgi:hypothetical protein